MNKLFKLIVMIVFSFMLLSGCNEEVNSDMYGKTETSSTKVTEEEKPYTLTEKDFNVKSKDSCIEFGGVIDDLYVNEKLTYHRPLSEKRAYEIYKYENFTLEVALDNTIFSIDLFTSEFETARGIKVGDSIDKVFEKYGMTEKDENSYDYQYDGPDAYRWITFEVDENEIITGIHLEAL